MKKRNILVTLVLIVAFLIKIGLVCAGEPTEESLLKTWEAMQKNDAKTKIFEKEEDKQYRFKTERFPFDGKIKILNIIIDNESTEINDGFIRGIIEVDFLDVTTEDRQKFGYGYYAWIQNNYLYYDLKGKKWLTTKEYADIFKKKYINASSNWFDLEYLWFLIPVAFFVFTVFWLQNIKKPVKQQDTYYRESLPKVMQLSEENNRILKDVHETLRDILIQLKKNNISKE